MTPDVLVPECCWCKGPIALEGRFAWCRDNEECRQKQIACAVSVVRNGQHEWLFVPSPKQTMAMMAVEPNLFVWGNRGGGKSVCFRWFCHALAMAIPNFRYAILRTSFPELMKNHLIYLDGEMEKMGGEKNGFRYHVTDHVCYYPNGSIGFYAQCATDGDVKKILGAEVALVVFDEAPTFQWEHMRLIAASVRVPAGSGLTPMVRYLGNPVGDSIDELWRYFIDRDVDLDLNPDYREEEWRSIEIHVQDNPYLDAKQYWKQFSGLPKHYIKAWKEGIRVEENTLFEFLPTVDGKPYHVISERPRFGDSGEDLYTVDANGVYHFPNWVRIFRAYDHGFWPDPAVCLWFAAYGRRILVFKEMTWYRRLAADIAAEIIQESKGLHVTASYCDPSIDIESGSDVLSIKQKMENVGLPLDCAVNNRELYADAIHTMLEEKISEGVPRAQFLEGACPMTVKYLPRMKFDPRNPAAMDDHKMDHWPVAFAYFAMMQIPTTKPSQSVKINRWQLPKVKPRTASARVIARLHRAR